MDPAGLPEDSITVYRLYNAADQLLYVGQTRNFRNRLGAHRLRAWDWPAEISSWKTEEFPDQRSAVYAERLAILTEAPLHNKQIANPWKIPPLRRKLNPYYYTQFVRVQYEAGELTIRQAFEQVMTATGTPARKTAHWLGLDDGGYACQYSHTTVEQLIQLNGLPSAP